MHLAEAAFFIQTECVYQSDICRLNHLTCLKTQLGSMLSSSSMLNDGGITINDKRSSNRYQCDFTSAMRKAKTNALAHKEDVCLFQFNSVWPSDNRLMFELRLGLSMVSRHGNTGWFDWTCWMQWCLLL